MSGSFAVIPPTGGIASINTDTTSAQVIAPGANVTVSTVAGTTTIASTSGGSGTVSSVSVTTANGVSGSVATATTTPAISLTLADITPTSVAASGTMTGSNLSGTNTGDQTNISGSAATFTGSLSGDIIGTQSSTVVSKIAGVSVGAPTGTTNAVFSNSPVFTGIPTAPTAGVGTSTTQIATTAFVLSQGFSGATGSMPFAHASSTSAQTSATTTYVTAISTTITTTAASAPVYAKATGTFTVTGAIPTVLKYRVSVNGVAGQEQLLSLTALTTNYDAAVQYISAALTPGTYTVLFEMARNSGTGTANFFEGTLDAIALQGTESNGITQLTGDVTAGAGSGSQAATIAALAVTNAKIANTTIDLTTKVTGILPLANGGTNSSAAAVNGAVVYSTASANALTAAGILGQMLRSTGAASPVWTTATYPATTTINQILYSSAANVITGLATTNTGALVSSSTGVPSLASGSTANRLLRTNGTTVSFAQANLTTDVTGTLPFAQGGTGTTTFANTRIPFSNGTILTTDVNLIYDASGRLQVGGGGGSAKINAIVASGSQTALQAFNSSGGNAFQSTNVSAYTAALISRQANATSGASIGFEFGRGTPAAPTGALNGDQIGVIVATPDAASGTAFGYCGAISFVAQEDATTTATGGDIVLSTTPNTTLVPVEHLRIKQSGENIFVNSHLKSTQTASTTVAPTANAGTGAATTLTNATDIAGNLELDLGTLSLSTGAQAIVTFSKAYNVAPIVQLTPINATAASNASAFGVYTTSSTSTFTVNFATAGVALSTLQWNYQIIETQ